MKRLISALMAISVVVSCVLSLSACSDLTAPDSQSGTSHNITTAPSVTPDDIEIIPTESPLNSGNLTDSDFVAVVDFIPDILIDLKYASTDNFTKTVIYDFNNAFLRYGTVKKLKAVSNELVKQGIYLKIWDAFRPIAAQHRLWEVYPDSNYVANPNTTHSKHSQGNAVDITLCDKNGNELVMPTGFDDFSPSADRDYSDCAPDAAKNAMLLQTTMEKHGFIGYEKEWWHFSDNTDYPVEECFNPTLISTWYADCNEFINLRKAPDSSSESIVKIPKNDRLTLLGLTGKFAMIDYKGTRGYVHFAYIQPIGRLSATFIEWAPNCDEYINMRTEPGGDVLVAKIPKGATVEFKEWNGKYALVSYDGKSGYVPANYIKPVSDSYFDDCLTIVKPTENYAHSQLLSDIDALSLLYPDKVQKSIIGLSEEGREIPVLIVGDQNADNHILIQASIHAREHMTSWIAMAVADYSLAQHYFDNTSICFHIIPVVNPDGVAISQSGKLGANQQSIYENDRAEGNIESSVYEYAQRWKANANGIDLNRNFSAGWDKTEHLKKPFSAGYRGVAPFCAAESRALRDYTLSRDFAATISLHSQGCIIYYQYGNRADVNEQSRRLALAISKTTGYKVDDGGATGAGFKDWAIDELGIPSVTVEIGVSVTPLKARDLFDSFVRCKELVPRIGAWVMNRSR